MRSLAWRSERGVIRLIVMLLILLVVIGAVVYVLNTRGVSWKETVYSVKQTSEDAATTTKVKTALALSKRASAFEINVDTNDRYVALSGQVPSEEVKKLAEAIAQETSGVKGVQNNLVVNPGAQPSPEAERVADLEIRSAIVEGIMENPELRTERVDVDVKKRTVTLTGSVETAAEKDRAELIARATEGVQSVSNHLAVTKPGSKPGNADLKLSRRVEFELYSSKAFDLNSIEIQAQNGRVTLNGVARSRAELLLAEKIAAGVEGVRDVVNNLQVTEGI